MLHKLRGAVGRFTAALAAIAMLAPPPAAGRTIPIGSTLPSAGYNQRYLIASNAFRPPSDWISASANYANNNDKKQGDPGTTPTSGPTSLFTASLSGTTLTVTAVTSGTVPGAGGGAVYLNGAYIGKISGTSTVNTSQCSGGCTGAGGAGTYWLNDAGGTIASTSTFTTGPVQAAIYGFQRRSFSTSWAPTQSKFLFSYRTQQVYGLETGMTSWTIRRAEINNGGQIIPMMLNGAPISASNPLVLTKDKPDQWVSPQYDPPGNSTMFFDTWDAIPGGYGSARPGALVPRTDLGEAAKNATAPFDTAAAPTSGTSSYNPYIGPAMFVAVPAPGTVNPIAVAIAADSLEDQTAYVVSGQCDWGWIRAALCSATNGRLNNIGFIRYSGTGGTLDGPGVGLNPAYSTGVGLMPTTVLDWLEARMAELGQQAYPFNRFIYEHFRNEGGGSPATTQGYQLAHAYRTKARTPGLKWYGMTPLPYTTTTDGWATETNQTDAYVAGNRSAQIAFVKANGNGAFDGYLDVAGYLQSLTSNGSNANVWPAPARSGTLSAALSSKTNALSLSYLPAQGDCITIDPAKADGASSLDIADMVASTSGSSAPYSTTLRANTTVTTHSQGVGVASRLVQDGTHECHSTMANMAAYTATTFKPGIQ